MITLAFCLIFSCLTPHCAAGSIAAAADWRLAHLSMPLQAALKGAGYALNPDGGVVDRRSNRFLSPEELDRIVARLKLAAPRARVEGLQATLSAPRFRASPYFDGSRPQAQTSVKQGTPDAAGSSPSAAAEKSLSSTLQPLAGKRLRADPFASGLLARLAAASGTPRLPPILIDDVGAGEARYDPLRRALIFDRAAVAASIASAAPAKDRAALARSISTRRSLIGYLYAHPNAVATFVEDNDAVLVHELAHAWQDRREPILREAVLGRRPRSALVEYELEAWRIKNLYIASRLRSSPSAALNESDLRDFEEMTLNESRWAADLRKRYGGLYGAALDVAATRDDRWAGALKDIARQAPGLLARRYTTAAEQNENPIEKAVLLRKAKDWARRGQIP